LFGIELASFNREIVDAQGNEHEPRSLISSSFNLAGLGHHFGSALKSHYAIKDWHTFLADLDKLGDNCDKQGSAAGASLRFMIFAGFGDNKTSAGTCCPADENRQIQGEKRVLFTSTFYQLHIVLSCSLCIGSLCPQPNFDRLLQREGSNQ